MYSGLKAGASFPPQQVAAAELILKDHHASDPSMAPQWAQSHQNSNMQQLMGQMMMALNQQDGQHSYANYGYGGWQQQGRNGRASGNPQGKPKPCCRCGSNYHQQSQCPVRTDGSLCRECGKPGHLPACCKSKPPPSPTDLCKCCGNAGCTKPECPWKDAACERCGKVGHTIHVCRKPPGYSPPAAKNTPKDKQAATAPQPPKQTVAKAPPVAVEACDPDWTYRCEGCSFGIKDPDLSAVQCPHIGCKVKDPRGKENAAKVGTSQEPKSAFSCTFTKATIETEKRIGAAGPGGGIAPSQQDQKTAEEMKQLLHEIASMKDLRLRSLAKDPNSTEFKAEIAAREAEVLKLKKTIPVQEAQAPRDTAAAMSVLAELETKRAQEREKMEAKLSKVMARQTEVVSNGEKEKKSIDDRAAEQKLKIDQNVQQINDRCHQEQQELRDGIDAMEKEAKRRMDDVQASAKLLQNTVATSAATLPTSGAVSMEVAPGSILHSSHVHSEVVQAYLTQTLGMNPEQTASTSQAFFGLMNMLALKVAPPTQPTPEDAASQPQQTGKEAVVVEIDKEESQEEVPETAPMDAEGEFTDGSTDSEAEAKAATENLPATKIKKRKTRGGKGSQGKGAPADTIKPNDTGKLKKK